MTSRHRDSDKTPCTCDLTMGIACVHVIDKKRPVLLMWRDREDGVLGFACGRGDHDPETIDDWGMSHVSHFLDDDPAVAVVRRLPRGQGVERDRPGAPWRRVDRRPS